LCLCSLMLVSNQVYSQSHSRTSALEVVVDESSNAYFNISFEKGQTLYSICKEFHIATIDAMMLNEIVNPDQISIGEQLLLPLNKEFFRVKKPSGSGFIPVYYKVKKQETLFRISKVYFAQDVKDMIERNELSGFTLSIDQNLLVGYYQIDGSHPVAVEEIAATQKPAVSTPVVEAPIVETRTATETTTTTKSVPSSNDYVLVDKNVVSEDKIVRHTQEVITTQEAQAKPEIKTSTEITTTTEVISTPKEVITESQPATREIERVVVPTERTVVTRETESTIEEKTTKPSVDDVPAVATYESKPTLKERIKKVIGTDKLDHSVSDNKHEQIRKINEAQQAESTTEEIVETSVDTITTQPVVEKPTSNLVSQSRKGIAYWDKKGKDYENLMVLHKTAEVNTLIKLTNPVNGLSTFARVVGKIPENAFKKDIDVVLSPAVARKIGAIDSRMQIAMTYQIIKP